VTLSDEQAKTITRHLSNGARRDEAARMASAPWTAFVSDWRAGRADFEAGKDSPEATFYSDSEAARSRHRATARAKAQASAGTRESADLLAYVKALEAEPDPLGDDLSAAPNAVRLTQDDDPDIRAAAAVQLEACRSLLRAVTARDARERGEGIGATLPTLMEVHEQD
jgi:hypothetical protein